MDSKEKDRGQKHTELPSKFFQLPKTLENTLRYRTIEVISAVPFYKNRPKYLRFHPNISTELKPKQAVKTRTGLITVGKSPLATADLVTFNPHSTQGT